MVEEVFECPVIAQALEQVVVRMRMGIHQARQYQTPGGIETVRVGCKRQGLTNSTDAIGFDKNIGTFKSRVRSVEYMSTIHQERHRISSTRDGHACLWVITSFPSCSMPQNALP